MIDSTITFLIAAAGIINFLPAIGLSSRAKLERLYGIQIENNNSEILMRHRAVMFGMIGGFMIYAALNGALQFWAVGAGMLSMTSFIVLALMTGQYTPHISKIIKADILGIICLLIAGALMLR